MQMVKEYQKIWLKDNSIYTNDQSIWKVINDKLKTSIQDRQEKPKSGMDAGLKFVVTYREFLQLAGDISAEYHFQGKTRFERPVLKKKIQRYLEYEYDKKMKRNPPDKKKEINEELLAQLRQTKRIKIKDKIPQINNFFRDIGLNGNLFEEDGTDITQKVFSVIGPEYTKPKVKKKRQIELGPHERGIIEFCNFEMNPLDSKKWPDARTRFKDMVGKRIELKKVSNSLTHNIYHLQPLQLFLETDEKTNTKSLGKIGPIFEYSKSKYTKEIKEVNKIIKELNEKQYYALVGEKIRKTPVAGNVGYELIKEGGWNVLYLSPESFEEATTTEIINEIQILKNMKNKSLVIIDESQEHFSKVKYVVERVQFGKINILWVLNLPYTFKELELLIYQKLSMQYHRENTFNSFSPEYNHIMDYLINKKDR